MNIISITHLAGVVNPALLVSLGRAVADPVDLLSLNLEVDWEAGGRIRPRPPRRLRSPSGLYHPLPSLPFPRILLLLPATASASQVLCMIVIAKIGCRHDGPLYHHSPVTRGVFCGQLIPTENKTETRSLLSQRCWDHTSLPRVLHGS